MGHMTFDPAHFRYKMAEEMRADAMEHIQEYLATQLMMQSSSSKPTLRARRGEGQDKVGRRRGHVGVDRVEMLLLMHPMLHVWFCFIREKMRDPPLASHQEGPLLKILPPKERNNHNT